jgi:hypothetical protein
MLDKRRAAERIWYVFRRPVVMEDEGRHFNVEGPLTYSEAETWIAAQAGQYFGPGDYYIVGPVVDDARA